MQLFNVYPLFPLEPVSASGAWITDKKGKKYLDFYGGHGVISIGHSHPHYVKKLTYQLGKIGFYSNSVIISQQQELADKLGALCDYPDYNLFLCNSGAEANENAMKLASFVTGRSKIIALKKAFHGRTSLAVEATDDVSIRARINRHDHVTFVELNDEVALEAAFSGEVAAFIFEGIQGVGGVHEPSAPFLEKAARLCRKYGAFLIADEIQSGFGRSGKFFAHQYSGVRADIITMAKGMGNGFPVAGLLITPEVKANHGMLGTTFGGNHLACTAATAVLDVLASQNLLEAARYTGEYLMKKLRTMGGFKELRGRGLMIGLEIPESLYSLRTELLVRQRIFTGASGKNVIRLLPPLNITKEEADHFINAVEVCLTPEIQMEK
ncbi:MAG: aspartate aminotransferase family protein [Bacteroidia bacterium]|nr:aspartate aminotransferase family protein [Bacteroidia bacterium]